MTKMIIESVIIAVLVMCVQVRQVHMLPVSKTEMQQLDLEETAGLMKTDMHQKQWYLSRTLLDPGADVSGKQWYLSRTLLDPGANVSGTHILSRIKRAIGSFQCPKGETLLIIQKIRTCVSCNDYEEYTNEISDDC